MKLINGVWTELISLFVDDGPLAVAVLVWLTVCWRILPRLALAPIWRPMLLFAGLVLILAESSLRRARFQPKPPSQSN